MVTTLPVTVVPVAPLKQADFSPKVCCKCGDLVYFLFSHLWLRARNRLSKILLSYGLSIVAVG